MTLAGIMQLAMRQLDEDLEDISEVNDLFTSYANLGYDIAVREFLRPRETRPLRANRRGFASIEGMDIERIVRVWDEKGRECAFEVTPDGGHIRLTGAAQDEDARRRGESVALEALCEVRYAPLMESTDEPRLPPSAQAALADYICFRHLSSGNLAKQSRARFFEDSFYRTMRAMRQDGFGSVTRPRNLYAVTDVRYRG